MNRASQRATAISPVSSRWRITILRFGVSAICKNRCSAVARIEHAEFGQCTVTLVPFFTEAALLRRVLRRSSQGREALHRGRMATMDAPVMRLFLPQPIRMRPISTRFNKSENDDPEPEYRVDGQSS